MLLDGASSIIENVKNRNITLLFSSVSESFVSVQLYPAPHS
jgi:hypothetical protein